jgi:hypothetical protein
LKPFIKASRALLITNKSAEDSKEVSESQEKAHYKSGHNVLAMVTKHYTFAIGLLLFSSILYANGYVQGALKVTIKSASDLPDEDGWWNLSDPYVVVTAYMYDGTSEKEVTETVHGNLNPVFNEELAFEEASWSHFYIQAYDSDVGEDATLTDKTRVDIVASDSGKTQSTATSGPRVTYAYYI